jgi:hypothetical protein
VGLKKLKIMKEEDCEHSYTPDYTNVWGRPSCEKCGKLMPYEDMD